MSQPSKHLLRRFTYVLAWITTVGLFIVNIVGFLDTETGSALGCGREWPLCNGNIIPSKWGLHTLIEFSHRGLVGLVTLALLVVSALVLTLYRGRPRVRMLTFFAVGFVMLEALLGALGVLFVDPPAVLASHFGVALIAFAAVLLLTLTIGDNTRNGDVTGAAGKSVLPVMSRSFIKWTRGAWVYLYLAMYVGAYIASSGAGDQFHGWPFPTESYASAGVSMVLDFVHRAIAIGFILILLYIARMAVRTRFVRPDLYRGSLIAVGLGLLQAVTGGLLVLTHLRTWAFLLHVSVVSLLFAAVCYVALQAWPARQTTRAARVRLPKTREGNELSPNA